MSRRKTSEVQFGSDSFLDVVCNIVGILIILIVIAGVRVSHAPVLPPRLQTAEETPGEPELPAAAGELVGSPLDGPPDDAPQLRRQIAAAEEEQAALAEQLQRGRGQLAAVNEQQAALSERLGAVRATVDKSQTALNAAQQAFASTTAELSSLKELAAQLAAQFRTAQLEPDKLQRLEHRITPVGRVVAGDELHFRIEHGRVSLVPLDPLLKRLKEQVERRKDWLVKARQHEGQVGPVDGYTLRYVVQRDNLSVVDELRYGAGMYRISVAHWQVDVDRDAVHESVQQALRPGSRFYQAILEAKSESAITFWVYPDSFEAFGQLKTFCHEQNFLVAGRPLPEGVPIAGSPNGTKSSGQ